MELSYEECEICNDHTGRAGRNEDSIFFLDGMIGPLCEECLEQLRREIMDGMGLEQTK